MAKNENDPPSSGRKPRVLTGPEAEEVRVALEWEREHHSEIDADEMRRSEEISRYPLSAFKGKKLPPLPGKGE